MLFNSIAFLLFLPAVFLAYWLMNRWTDRQHGLKLQNAFLLGVSYLFYGWWDWRFLGLIAFSTVVDYFAGMQIARRRDGAKGAAKGWLAASLAVNLGLLGYFKYANFFIDSWVTAWGAVGVEMHTSTLQIILPVGISFYTFQTLSYSIDIYRNRLEPTRDFISFAAFVSFFPQLVAGPIERASALLPQLLKRRTFSDERASSGIRLALWGMFKKVVVADRLAGWVDVYFAAPEELAGGDAALALVFFGLQLYLDFSAYSDIAIGIARMLGIELMTNFRRPYFARSFSDFWERWHISLSSWFRDYVYIPLGGSRNGKWRTWRNVLVVFLVSGLWHGASWNFVIWGGLNGLFLIAVDPLLTRFKGRVQRVVAPVVVTAGWCLSLAFFRGQGWEGATEMLTALMRGGGSAAVELLGTTEAEWRLAWWSIVAVLAVDAWGEWHEFLAKPLSWSPPRWIRWAGYAVVSWAIVLFGIYGVNLDDAQFIYFQF